MQSPQRQLLKTIKENPDISPAELVSLTGKSKSTVHNNLKKLLQGGFIERTGTPPRVQYRAINGVSETIQNTFLYKTPSGKLIFGMEGFRVWAEKKFQEKTFEKKVTLYEEGIKKYNKSKKNDLFFVVDSILKIPKESIAFDALYCLDLYNIQIGDNTKRTKEAVLLEVAKGSGNPKKIISLTEKYITSSVERINNIIAALSINSIAFVPPTAMRKVQVMRLLEKEFTNTNVHTIDRIPIRRDFSDSNMLRQEQKHITNITNRITNARKTYTVPITKKKHNKLLLVDDLVGSGATVNEIAKKIKDRGIAKEVHCLCLVGINAKKMVVIKKM